ncbi:MAG: hypothetical protein RLZZ387_4089, partial [Chloroflexota bacterium]
STSISNQVSIRAAYDAGSADLAEHARRQAWWPVGEQMPFDVARAYIDPAVPRQLSHIRATRSRQLLAERHGQITPEWMTRIARDHYEGTFLEGPYFDAADPDFLSICMHVSPAGFTWGNTASSCVATLPRSPEEAPVFWWTPGPPCLGCYVPFFVNGGELPAVVSRAGTAGKRVVAPHQAQIDDWAPGSYWWMFRRLTDVVKGDPVASMPGYYATRSHLVRERFDGLEQEFATELPAVLQVYAASGDAAVLSAFTTRCIERVVGELREITERLGGA